MYCSLLKSISASPLIYIHYIQSSKAPVLVTLDVYYSSCVGSSIQESDPGQPSNNKEDTMFLERYYYLVSHDSVLRGNVKAPRSVTLI